MNLYACIKPPTSVDSKTWEDEARIHSPANRFAPMSFFANLTLFWVYSLDVDHGLNLVQLRNLPRIHPHPPPDPKKLVACPEKGVAVLSLSGLGVRDKDPQSPPPPPSKGSTPQRLNTSAWQAERKEALVEDTPGFYLKKLAGATSPNFQGSFFPEKLGIPRKPFV